MLHAKASVLLYRAARLGSTWSPPAGIRVLPGVVHLARPTHHALLGDTAADIRLLRRPAAARTLVLAHALTAAAAIRLYRSPAAADPQAQSKCVFGARAVLECLGDTRVGECLTTAHPIVGSLGALACRVLMEDVRRVQALRPAWAAPGAEEGTLRTDLRAGMEMMGMYAAGSPLIGKSFAALPR
ncbi:hypothetical protein C8R44DRAFT_894198 [Mycena epipterygia]|nr:hypothetical protein C8R44DRAFT_894198 [Mycena epipterygia]